MANRKSGGCKCCGGGDPGNPIISTPGCPCSTGPTNIMVSWHFGTPDSTDSTPMVYGNAPAGFPPPAQVGSGVGWWSPFRKVFAFVGGNTATGYWSIRCIQGTGFALQAWDVTTNNPSGQPWYNWGTYWRWTTPSQNGAICSPWALSGGQVPSPSSAFPRMISASAAAMSGGGTGGVDGGSIDGGGLAMSSAPEMFAAVPPAAIDQVAILADLCPMGAGPCGCGEGPPRLCGHPDRPAEVRRADCMACVARRLWEGNPGPS